MTFCLCFEMGMVSRDFNWFMSFTPLHYSSIMFRTVWHLFAQCHIFVRRFTSFTQFHSCQAFSADFDGVETNQEVNFCVLQLLDIGSCNPPSSDILNQSETTGLRSIPNPQPNIINGYLCVARSILYHFKLQAQDSQEALGRKLENHKRPMWSKIPESFTAMAGHRRAGFAKTDCRGGCIASISSVSHRETFCAKI